MKFEWSEVEDTVLVARRNLLYGPPGLGKTTILHKLAEREREEGKTIEIFSINLHDESTVAELIGHFMPIGGKFVWQDGPVLAAWRKSHSHEAWLIVDEIDLASGGVLSIMRGVANDEDVARISIPNQSLAGMSDEAMADALMSGEGQEHVAPGPGFKIVATMNGNPDDLDSPLLDRFDTQWHIVQPHPNAILSLSEDLRVVASRSCSQPDDKRRYSLRSWMAFDRLRNKMQEKHPKKSFDEIEDVAARAVWAERAGDALSGLRAERKLNDPNISEEEKKTLKREGPAPTVPPNMTENGKPVRVYYIKTGKSGRPPKAKCPGCENSYQTLMTATTLDEPLTCDSCNGVVANGGEFSAIQMHGTKDDGSVAWFDWIGD
jgi:MoxR-like ATPase